MCAVTEEQIKKLFSYDIEAEKHAINMMLSGNDQEISSALQDRINLVAKKEAAIQAFYCILTEHERLVIKRHVVDGIDWTCLSAEFAQKWGAENAKSTRSLIYYKNRAFKKMVQFVETHRDIYDFSWTETL